MATIIIGGDIYPGPDSIGFLKSGDAATVFEGLIAPLQKCDLAIANLEGPLVRQTTPIEKIGPHHAFEQECVKGLKNAGFGVFNLGNNHIMDHGKEGLENTLQVCQEHGIACVGAGENLETAGRLLIQKVNGTRIAILSYTEHEFGMATETEPGTHPIDAIHFVRTVSARRQEWDFLVVLLHAGNEYYPYPRPRLRNLARFMVEQGAGAVVFQHSHCAGCYEEYRGGHIIYGQGNLLFDTQGARPCEMEGFLVSLQIDHAGTSIKFVPYRQSTAHPGPEPMNPEERSAFLKQFEERSQWILQPGFVEKEWEKFCIESPYNYLSLLNGYPKRIRELDRKFKFLRLFSKRERTLMLLHLFRCESHHEAIMGALRSSLK